MQQLDSELGKCAIASHPADHDPREGELYAALQAEIGRLSSMHAAGMPDWPRVALLAQRYLREEAKDFSVACWLLAAWLYTEQGAGLVAGSRVLADLHRYAWDEMLPPRLRTRRNQMEWLAEQIERFMAAGQDLSPLEAEAHAVLLADWRAIDEIWQTRDDEMSLVMGILRRLAQWPVQDAGLDPQDEAVVATQEETEALPVASTATGPVETAETRVTPFTVPRPDMDDDAAPEALERALDQVMDAMDGPLEAGVRLYPQVALWYRLNRVRVWSGIEQVPPAQQGVTRIPAPQERQREQLAQRLAGGEQHALLQYAEAQLPTCRFWLDLNRAAHVALHALPECQAAAGAVARETSALLARLPGLEMLAFSDGTPFADDETRHWLAGLMAQSSIDVSAPGNAFPVATPTHRTEAVPAQAAAGMVALATALAGATAQAESAQMLLASALSRLHDSAQQVARYASPEHQPS